MPPACQYGFMCFNIYELYNMQSPTGHVDLSSYFIPLRAWCLTYMYFCVIHCIFLEWVVLLRLSTKSKTKELLRQHSPLYNDIHYLFPFTSYISCRIYCYFINTKHATVNVHMKSIPWTHTNSLFIQTAGYLWRWTLISFCRHQNLFTYSLP